MTSKSKVGALVQPWHYDAFEGRPEWSKELARQHVLRRQRSNMDAHRAKAEAGRRERR
jgi:hypothetical protein